jgi:hypothetical protein
LSSLVWSLYEARKKTLYSVSKKNKIDFIFFALYFTRYSLLYNIIKGSIHHTTYAANREREWEVYIYLHTVFSLCVLVHRTLFEIYDAFWSGAPARMIVKITTSSLIFYGLLAGTIFKIYTNISKASIHYW